MAEDVRTDAGGGEGNAEPGYVPPAVTYLGSLVEMTAKLTGASDGTTMFGVDLGSFP